MDKLNIEMLFNNKTNNSSSGALDIKSLFNQDKRDLQFTPEELIKKRERKRETLHSNYETYYKRCLEKIEVASSLNKEDIVYNVPKFIADCPEYNPIDCLEYIEINLKNKYMDTFRINKNSIFITWKYIEINYEKMKKK